MKILGANLMANPKKRVAKKAAKKTARKRVRGKIGMYALMIGKLRYLTVSTLPKAKLIATALANHTGKQIGIKKV